MHSLHCKGGTTFHFNSDLSGEVIVQTGCTSDESGIVRAEHEIEVAGRDILALVAHHLVNERIARLEQMGNAEVLGLERIPE